MTRGISGVTLTPEQQARKQAMESRQRDLFLNRQELSLASEERKQADLKQSFETGKSVSSGTAALSGASRGGSAVGGGGGGDSSALGKPISETAGKGFMSEMDNMSLDDMRNMAKTAAKDRLETNTAEWKTKQGLRQEDETRQETWRIDQWQRDANLQANTQKRDIGSREKMQTESIGSQERMQGASIGSQERMQTESLGSQERMQDKSIGSSEKMQAAGFDQQRDMSKLGHAQGMEMQGAQFGQQEKMSKLGHKQGMESANQQQQLGEQTKRQDANRAARAFAKH